jgi:hypothetical protein
MRTKSVLGALVAAAVLAGCQHTVYRAQFSKPDEKSVDAEAPFLKCHMSDGSLYLLEHWKLATEEGVVRGEGVHLDSRRRELEQGALEVPMGSVVLFETNTPESVGGEGGAVVLGVMTGVSLTVTALCLANPKACFGSCPTFYAFDGERESLQAEGFSASVARALEGTDVDAMWSAKPHGSSFQVRMTNDALETHVIDSVRLLVAPRPPGGRVLRAGDVYYPATSLSRPTACTAEAGNCLDDVVATDGREYKSQADAHDLATRETVELTFDHPAKGPRGLLIVARNSLLNTFLFYQGLAYMGRSAGEYIAQLERGSASLGALSSLETILGGIEVQVEDAPGSWRKVGAVDEVGPLALEAQVVPIPASIGTTGRVRLVATKGYWRIEQVALADLGAPIVPQPLEPITVSHVGSPRPDAKEKLAPGGEHLLSMPRDEWLLGFELPPGDSEIFLESRGYYYEWIRKSWLAEESAIDLARFVLSPRGELRRLAPKYKRTEADMDRIFWQSRLGAERVR